VVASAQTPADWATDNTAIDQAIADIKSSVRNLEIQALGLESIIGILTTRRIVTEDMVGVLNTGAANLVNADIQAETAAQLANNSRQDLATTAMTLAAQSTKQVLQLMG
jgi:flagellin